MLKVLYAGSPEASAKTLEILLQDSEKSSDYKIVGVLTNPPSAQGRHKELIPTEVAKIAMKWNESHNFEPNSKDYIQIFTPVHLDSSCREQIACVSPDIFVCFAYGHIFGPKFLAMFSLGGINLHPSLLPKYRGCTPVNAALLNCDAETGYSIQKVSLATDEGDILFQNKKNLNGTETASELLNCFAIEGASSLTEILSYTSKHNELPCSHSQTGESSYCQMIKKEDGKINWNDSAKKIDAMIRAYTPWPGCFTEFNGIQLRIIKGYAEESTNKNNEVPGTVISYDKSKGIIIQCGEGNLVALELQLQAKKAMDYKAFMNGARDFIGSLLK